MDSALVAQYEPTVLDLQQQVDDEYLPIYGTDKAKAKSLGAHWGATTSLTGIWIGINDVGNSYSERNGTLNAAIFDVYSHLVEEVRFLPSTFPLLSQPQTHEHRFLSSTKSSCFAQFFDPQTL